MKSLHEMVGKNLEWNQPEAMKRYFELKVGAETVAKLSFRSIWGSLATAETAEGSWTFKRVGFWQTKVTIRRAESDGDLAVFSNSTWSGGGTLEMADGRRFHANTNLWMTRYEFKTEADEWLVRFERVRGLLHFASNVEISHVGGRLPELPWLVPLGWYLALKMMDDAGGAAAAAAG